MKQCVAPVSSRMVTRRRPWGVEMIPDKRGLNEGLCRTHGRNPAGPARTVASCVYMACANSSTVE